MNNDKFNLCDKDGNLKDVPNYNISRGGRGNNIKDINVYVESIDHGSGYINYYQNTTIDKLEKFIAKRGLTKIKIDGYEINLQQLKEYFRELKGC